MYYIAAAPSRHFILMAGAWHIWRCDVQERERVTGLFTVHGKAAGTEVLKKPVVKDNWQWLTKNKMLNYAFPQFINQYLKEEVQQLLLL